MGDVINELILKFNERQDNIIRKIMSQGFKYLLIGVEVKMGFHDCSARINYSYHGTDNGYLSDDLRQKGYEIYDLTEIRKKEIISDIITFDNSFTKDDIDREMGGYSGSRYRKY